MLEKLKILAFTDEMLTKKSGEYTVQINPEKYSQQYALQAVWKPTLNTGGVTKKYVVQKPQDLALEFYLDSTGVGPGRVNSVQDEIDKFKRIVYSYKGEIHSPNYLRVLWGKLSFDCRLDTMDIEYLLFTPAGLPLRAKVNTNFSQFNSPKKIEAEARKSSPDVTHRRTVVAGDTLPLLCFQIYQDSKYYVDIARVNRLDNFRRLEPGQQIMFPPLGD